jgi:hypothetical protein
MELWFVKAVRKHLNSSTLSKELLSFFILRFCPAFCSPDMAMYLVLSAFTSRPISLLANTNAVAFFLYSMYTSLQYVHFSTVCTLLCSMYTSLQYVHFSTVCTLLCSMYTSLQYVHFSAVCTLLYSMYTSLQYVRFSTVSTLPPNIWTSSALTKSCCVPFNFKPSRFTWTLLMSKFYSKVEERRDTASPISSHSQQKTRETNVGLPDCAAPFIQTHFY